MLNKRKAAHKRAEAEMFIVSDKVFLQANKRINSMVATHNYLQKRVFPPVRCFMCETNVHNVEEEKNRLL